MNVLEWPELLLRTHRGCGCLYYRKELERCENYVVSQPVTALKVYLLSISFLWIRFCLYDFSVFRTFSNSVFCRISRGSYEPRHEKTYLSHPITSKYHSY